MAPKAKKTKKKSRATKTATAKTTKKAARNTGRSSAKTKATKKGTAKAAKKTTLKAGKKASKTTSRRSAATSGRKKSATGLESKETVLVLDESVTDAPPGPQGKNSGVRKPQTPTAPRSVKPPPKSADVEMGAEVLEFVAAIDAYRQENCRPFPTWTEVFSILKKLGYAKS